MQKVHSYTKERGKNCRIEIESVLNPGLPKVSFSGFHEGSARESLLRVKSAIQNQDFEWSLDKHLVFSTVSRTKVKSSLCDLSFAASVFLKTGQLELKSSLDVVFLGELTVDGHVRELSLSENGFAPKENEIWIGNFKEQSQNIINIEKLNDLRSLKKEDKELVEEQDLCFAFTKQVQMLSPVWVELFELLVHGEHSVLFMTPQNPELFEFFKLIQKNLTKLRRGESSEVRLTSQGLRPLVVLNPAVTKLQILGHAPEERQGLYSYANGGMVCMDHFFTLNKGVREAVSSLLRGGGLLGDKNLKSMLCARSPLCPCGKAKVGQPKKCGYSLYKCRSLIERISIDELSLFQVVVASRGSWQELYPHPELDLSLMNQRRKRAYRLQEERGQVQPNSRLDLYTLTSMMSEVCKTTASLPKIESLERTHAILSVARSLADLEGSLEIESEHIERSKFYVFTIPKELMSAF